MAGRLTLPFLMLAGLGACGGQADLRLAAAASLSEVLPPLLAEFEQESGLHVETVYGGSGELVAQFRHGAPFDALLLAGMGESAAAMVEDGRLAVEQPALLSNFVVLAAGPGWGAPADRQLRISTRWAELKGRRVAIGGEAVPAGNYARAWMERDGLDPGLVELIPFEHVRAVLAAVQSGACAAGFVYFSDLAGHGGLELIGADLAPGSPYPASYPFLTGAGIDPERRRSARTMLAFLQGRMPDFERAGFRAGASAPTQEDCDALFLLSG